MAKKYKEMTFQQEKDLRELCYLKWDKYPKIREDFRSKEAFASYEIYRAKGCVRIYAR